MPDDLMTDVRNMLDRGAPPITFDEMTDHAARAPRLPGRSRRYASRVVACGVAACLVAVMFAVITGRDDRPAVATFASADVECGPSPDANLQVFLTVGATDDQIAAARAGIAQTPGVEIDRYLGPDAAHDQFACIFSDNPDLVDSVSSADLPVSFAVTSDSAGAGVVARLESAPNVEGVYTPTSWQKHVDHERARETIPT